MLEFNCRFGDPETQSVLPLVDGDLLAACAAAARGDLGGVELAIAPGASVTVVVAAADYPAARDSGSPIDGIEDAERSGALVFHAGTALHDGRVRTNGGRVLNVTAVGDTLAAARERAYAAVELVVVRGRAVPPRHRRSGRGGRGGGVTRGARPLWTDRHGSATVRVTDACGFDRYARGAGRRPAARERCPEWARPESRVAERGCAGESRAGESRRGAGRARF